ncbi:MAG: divalent metal cation transporter [Saprospirales bacterium]|nr:divalent metal cation transporter [Saprospirales bacterium]
MKKNLLSILFWSILAAAFVGPGTVTTAAKSGAGYGTTLLWALVFSTLATIFLQEAAARIPLVSGKNLGELIALQYQRMPWMRWGIFGALAFGCAAYETGNLLGAMAGWKVMGDTDPTIILILITALSATILLIGKTRLIALIMGLIVAFMGFSFLYVALKTSVDWEHVVKNCFTPSISNTNSLLVIGLIGTTIVPYNLFLGSGIGKGQELGEMRIGIIIAVLLGGLISGAILIVGTQIQGEFSFEALSQALAGELGPWAPSFFGFGLLAAGWSSAITAPLAAAITGASLFGEKWQIGSRPYHLTWMVVLLTGFVFGLMQIQPIPAIILAQALNGILLPLVTAFLFLAINDRRFIPASALNRPFVNGILLLVVGITTFLGMHYVLGAFGRAFPVLGEMPFLNWVKFLVAFGLILYLGRQVFFPK